LAHVPSGELVRRLREHVAEIMSRYAGQVPEALAPVEEEPGESVFASRILDLQPPEGDLFVDGPWKAGAPDGKHEVVSYGVEASAPTGLVVGVDGSSSVLSSAINIAVFSSAIAGGGLFAVYPGLARHAPLELPRRVETRSLAVAAPAAVKGLNEIALVRPLVYTHEGLCKRLRGDLADACNRLKSYWGYQKKTMADENRIFLETLALEEALRAGFNMVLVDGPIYSTPGLFKQLQGVRGWRGLYRASYAASYLANIIARALVVGPAQVPVIGVVKRLSASKTLLHALGLGDYYPGDEALIRALVPRILASAENPQGALLLGPVYVTINIDSAMGAIEGSLASLAQAREKSPCATLAPYLDWMPLLRSDYARFLSQLGVKDVEQNPSVCLLRRLLKQGKDPKVPQELGKLVAYLVVPRRPDWLGEYTVLRLEAPVHDNLDTAWATLAQAASVVAYDLLHWNSGVPWSIGIADRLAGSVVRSLAETIYRGLSDVVGGWSYETSSVLEGVVASV